MKTRPITPDRLCSLQARTDTVDAAGGPVVTWAESGRLYVQMFAAIGERRDSGETDRWRNGLRARTRHRTDLQPGRHRVVMDGTPYELLACHEDAQAARRTWTILHLERVEGGQS